MQACMRGLSRLKAAAGSASCPFFRLTDLHTHPHKRMRPELDALTKLGAYGMRTGTAGPGWAQLASCLWLFRTRLSASDIT